MPVHSVKGKFRTTALRKTKLYGHFPHIPQKGTSVIRLYGKWGSTGDFRKIRKREARSQARRPPPSPVKTQTASYGLRVTGHGITLSAQRGSSVIPLYGKRRSTEGVRIFRKSGVPYYGFTENGALRGTSAHITHGKFRPKPAAPRHHQPKSSGIWLYGVSGSTVDVQTCRKRGVP